MPPLWTIYILRCGDDSLYTGVTTDIARRLSEHNSPVKGAKYTRSRQPVQLVYTEQVSSRPEACRREGQIKKMRRAAKLALIDALAKTLSRP